MLSRYLCLFSGRNRKKDLFFPRYSYSFTSTLSSFHLLCSQRMEATTLKSGGGVGGTSSDSESNNLTNKATTNDDASGSIIRNGSNVVAMIVGPTASGKSKLAMELCMRLGGEIIVADCVQVYQHVTIASNKPTKSDVSKVPHHLIDCFELNKQVTSGDFARLSSECIRDVLGRGKTPVIVGGSTMWNNWLVHGIPDAPKSTPEYRLIATQLIAKYKEEGDWDSAVALLENALKTKIPFDVSRNNWQRLTRYIEIAIMLKDNKGLKSGAVASSSGSNKGSSSNAGGGLSEIHELELDFPKLSGERISVLDDSIDLRIFFLSEHKYSLYRRIDTRCLQMLKIGLFEEITDLLISGHLLPNSTVAKAIGYRQTLEYLCRDNYSPQDFEALNQFIINFATITRNYAKKQFQWARRDKKYLWVSLRRDKSSKMGKTTNAASKSDRSSGGSSTKYNKPYTSSSILKSSSVASYSDQSLPRYVDIDKADSADNGNFYKLASEIQYLMSIPRSDYDKLLNSQNATAAIVKTISSSKSPYNLDLNLDADLGLERLVVAKLIAEGEIDAIAVLKKYCRKNSEWYSNFFVGENEALRDEYCVKHTGDDGEIITLPIWDLFIHLNIDSSFWLYKIFDKAAGVTPTSLLDERRSDASTSKLYSSSSTTIRLLEDEKLMKTYHSYLETLSIGSKGNQYNDMIIAADACAQKLRREVPELVETFRIWCKENNGDEDENV